mgnify:FL=1
MTAITELDTVDIEAQRDALIERMLNATIATWNVAALFLGSRLGLYDALASEGPATPGELAARTGTAERYVREWLEQQAVSGFLHVDNPVDPAGERRYALPTAHAEVLTERESLNYLAPLPQIVVGALSPLDRVLQAFRTGEGVGYHEYGVHLHEGRAGMNRNAFLSQLGQEGLPAVADVHERLIADPPARVADIGCGHAWSSIGMARAYPKALVDGFDLDAASVEAANRHIHAAGLAGRVTISERDAADPDLSGQYDLVTAFECIHDMPDPVGVLSSMRRLASGRGAVIVMDERVRETFVPETDLVEQFMYGFSILHCLPVGMLGEQPAGTGTVMRPDTLSGYARAAGFGRVELLPIESFFFNFYRLWP